jgi:predicted RNase H-like nuclease (RuvC/YqgF family)
MTTLKTANTEIEKLKEINKNLLEKIEILEKELDSFKKNVYISEKNKIPS